VDSVGKKRGSIVYSRISVESIHRRSLKFDLTQRPQNQTSLFRPI